jgi:hypothetical protein
VSVEVRSPAYRTDGSQPLDLPPEYLTIQEVAEWLRLSPKRVRTLMSAGIFREGFHFFRGQGIRPRFRWSRVVEWIEAGRRASEEAIPMARSTKRRVAELTRTDL